MMNNNYLEEYLATISKESLKKSVKNTVDSIIPKIKEASSNEQVIGMLLGNIQSGKTGQMFGVISAAADLGYKVFILLTTDQVSLQIQTYKRALTSLQEFNVCTESDDVRFNSLGTTKPVLIVLKKNSSILKTWKNRLCSSKFCKGIPLFVVDDEADASSLNTKVNKGEQSKINNLLDGIRKLSSYSVYLQVTATPQAILLQTKASNFQPTFFHYFEPGEGYLGGDFFYNENGSYAVKITNDELEDVRTDDGYIPDGLRKSVLSFLVVAAETLINKHDTCNFLIHPSVKISDHDATAKKIKEFLNSLLTDFESELKPHLKEIWQDLQNTKPDITEFEEIRNCIEIMLEEESIKIYIMNSKNTQIDVSSGFNIVIGGNSLGRGVTFPALQTVYYCRTSKAPQADTYWQHCRMFGYDRDAALTRVYMPANLFKLFTDLNNSNAALIKQLRKSRLEEISLLYPPKIKPTRSSVVDKGYLNIVVGDVNYFPSFVTEKNLDKLDTILSGFDSSPGSIVDIDIDLAIELLELIDVEKFDDWSAKAFINTLKAWKASKEPGATSAKLIVRDGRSIRKASGTLLSETDRLLGARFKNIPVLTMYRLNGEKENGWNGVPIWVPNIKLPEGKNFYKTEG